MNFLSVFFYLIYLCYFCISFSTFPVLMRKIINIKNGVARHPAYRMKNPVNFSLEEGECMAIAGNNGAGKSMLVDIITEKHPLLINHVEFDFTPSKSKNTYDNITHITFHDSYGTEDGTYYYQQRWNQHDIDGYPTVRQLLNDAENIVDNRLESELSITDKEKQDIRKQRTELKTRIQKLFDLESLLDKRIVMLSSGELRKFQLTKSLIANPRVLILDNPFIGLDANARNQLQSLLKILITNTKKALILVLAKTDDIPDFVTHVVEVKNLIVGDKVLISDWKKQNPTVPHRVISEIKAKKIIELPYSEEFNLTNIQKQGIIVEFDNVNIKYGERIILNDISFKIKNQEHWALTGENGSGKSTLLSLICADNPQAYANNISLFGHKRGSGESIWDIKKYIGYISPEMHRAYQRDYPAIEIVASGLRDSIGLYHKPKPHQIGICEFWMDIFGVEHLARKSFLKLSSGEQRLVLLARTFVKDPALLILDEPLHGLDLTNRRLVKDIIETFCRRKNKTLIMVTHYTDEFPSIIDHKIHLNKINLKKN